MVGLLSPKERGLMVAGRGDGKFSLFSLVDGVVFRSNSHPG